MSTPHEILGTSPNATEDEIRLAYRRACVRCHPDRGGSSEEFQAVTKAYEALMARPCELCGGKGFVVERRGMLATKRECPKCWKT